MIRNVESLKGKVRHYSTETGLSVQQVLQHFMFERFLERLSNSKYKDNFIIKGGCLLSSIMGVNSRTTRDIDANIIGIDFNQDTITEIISTTIAIDIDDNVNFILVKVKEIRLSKKYNGYRFTLTGCYGNLRISFHIDITTGDIVTPRAIKYEYKMILENDSINILAYNSETIFAEKLQAILYLKTANSRMKDYYDIFYFLSDGWTHLDKKILVNAIHTTFTNRNTLDDLYHSDIILYTLESDKKLNELWLDYQTVFFYSKNISFQDIIHQMKEFSIWLKPFL